MGQEHHSAVKSVKDAEKTKGVDVAMREEVIYSGGQSTDADVHIAMSDADLHMQEQGLQSVRRSSTCPHTPRDQCAV